MPVQLLRLVASAQRRRQSLHSTGRWSCCARACSSSIDCPRQDAAGQSREVRKYLHASPRSPLSPPSRGGPSCAYTFAGLRAFNGQVGPVPEPCFQLPLSDRCMRCLFCYWRGAQHLPIEMGRRLHMARVGRICLLCPGMHVGDERHYVFKGPAFDAIRCGFQHLLDGSHVMWGQWGHALFHAPFTPDGYCFVLVAALDVTLNKQSSVIHQPCQAGYVDRVRFSLSLSLALHHSLWQFCYCLACLARTQHASF